MSESGFGTEFTERKGLPLSFERADQIVAGMEIAKADLRERRDSFRFALLKTMANVMNRMGMKAFTPNVEFPVSVRFREGDMNLDIRNLISKAYAKVADYHMDRAVDRRELIFAEYREFLAETLAELGNLMVEMGLTRAEEVLDDEPDSIFKVGRVYNLRIDGLKVRGFCSAFVQGEPVFELDPALLGWPEDFKIGSLVRVEADSGVIVDGLPESGMEDEPVYVKQFKGFNRRGWPIYGSLMRLS